MAVLIFKSPDKILKTWKTIIIYCYGLKRKAKTFTLGGVSVEKRKQINAY